MGIEKDLMPVLHIHLVQPKFKIDELLRSYCLEKTLFAHAHA